MIGLRARRPLLAVAASLLAALLAAAPAAVDPAAAADRIGAADASGSTVEGRVARLMTREHAALDALGHARIEAIADGRAAAPTPEGAAAASTTTLAARNLSPDRLDAAALDALPPASGDAQWRCLAEAIYFESRGEPLAGQIGVAEVVLNRVDSRAYPNTICGVTRQGAGSGGGCQFSYACDGLPETLRTPVARERAEKLARLMLDGLPRTVTDGATHFHARYVQPGWSRKFARTATIGNHLFYRQPTQVALR